MPSLFLKPPVIDPNEFLPANEAAKVAAVRLTSPPGYWDDEIRQTLLREHPYVPSDRVIVNFSQKDDATGSATGYISIAGAPNVSIPVIVKNRQLAPLDILVLRQAQPAGSENDQQGAGDMTEDEVLPLNEDTFARALDTGPVGTAVPPHQLQGLGYTEDGTALRLPFRGRTVMASLAEQVGATDRQKDILGQVIAKNADVSAGILLNHTGSVFQRWLNAPAPQHSLHTKLAAKEIPRAIAHVVDSAPSEIKTADILAAEIFVSDETCKTAIAFDAIDLANPAAGLNRWLAFDDGSYCRAPEKVAGHALEGAAEAAAVDALMTKIAASSMRMGQTLVFSVDGIFTAPAKLANLREVNGTVEMALVDGVNGKVDVVLDRRIKQATFDESTGTWILPVTARVLVLDDHAVEMPVEPAKIASALERQLTDTLSCQNGQWGLSIRGETFGSPQMSETKVARLLEMYFENGQELFVRAKTAAEAASNGVGVVRFASNVPDLVAEISKSAEMYAGLSPVLKKAAAEISIPLEKAAKLAAAIGDEDGVDAVLGAGFLTEDNLAEFVGLSGQFEECVGKLARLLLAVRMGFPGDESATVVAMKALSRVADRLQSAAQEV